MMPYASNGSFVAGFLLILEWFLTGSLLGCGNDINKCTIKDLGKVLGFLGLDFAFCSLFPLVELGFLFCASARKKSLLTFPLIYNLVSVECLFSKLNRLICRYWAMNSGSGLVGTTTDMRLLYHLLWWVPIGGTSHGTICQVSEVGLGLSWALPLFTSLRVTSRWQHALLLLAEIWGH